MRIISVLWRILPSGCNFYLQSGPSLSGSDSCEYQPTSLIRAARPSWQPGAELFCLQLNVPGLFFFFFQSVVQSASFSILRGNGAGDGKHIKPALSGETKQCWGRQTLRCWLNFPFFLRWDVWGMSGFFQPGMVFPKQHQCEDSLACNQMTPTIHDVMFALGIAMLIQRGICMFCSLENSFVLLLKNKVQK